MRTSPTTAKIDAAMARVQARLEPVRKNKGVKVDGEKAKWESRFATFATLHAACKDALAAENIAVYQGGMHVQGAGERLVTRLALEGEWIESDFPIKPSRDGSQGFGGGISFAKRWGLLGMVGLVTEDDHEEAQGYRDERPARPKKPAAPASIAGMLEAIREASAIDELTRAVFAARSAHPTGEPGVAVEKQISSWFVSALGVASNLDELTELRDACNRIKPRGNEVRSAIADAERRLMGEEHHGRLP